LESISRIWKGDSDLLSTFLGEKIFDEFPSQKSDEKAKKRKSEEELAYDIILSELFLQEPSDI
jgi:hypothetical protein